MVLFGVIFIFCIFWNIQFPNYSIANTKQVEDAFDQITEAVDEFTDHLGNVTGEFIDNIEDHFDEN